MGWKEFKPGRLVCPNCKFDGTNKPATDDWIDPPFYWLEDFTQAWPVIAVAGKADQRGLVQLGEREDDDWDVRNFRLHCTSCGREFPLPNGAVTEVLDSEEMVDWSEMPPYLRCPMCYWRMLQSFDGGSEYHCENLSCQYRKVIGEKAKDDEAQPPVENLSCIKLPTDEVLSEMLDSLHEYKEAVVKLLNENGLEPFVTGADFDRTGMGSVNPECFVIKLCQTLEFKSANEIKIKEIAWEERFNPHDGIIALRELIDDIRGEVGLDIGKSH